MSEDPTARNNLPEQLKFRKEGENWDIDGLLHISILAPRGDASYYYRVKLRGKLARRFACGPNGWIELWEWLDRELAAAQLDAVRNLVTGANASYAWHEEKQNAQRRALTAVNEEFRRVTSGAAALQGQIYLGGHGVGRVVRQGETYDLYVGEDSVVVARAASVIAKIDDPTGLEIDGPGLERHGGGFIGGGFGAKGAVEGMAIAAVLNAITTRTRVQTFLRLEFQNAEMFWLNTETTPRDLRIYLSAAAGSFRRRAEHRNDEEPSVEPDLVARLAQLAGLFEQKLLSEEEYTLAKRRLLEP